LGKRRNVPWSKLINAISSGIQSDEIDYEYDSDLFSLEWNIRRECPGTTFLFGPRFIFLEERVQVDTATTIIPPIPLPIFDAKPQYY
jgi:hypothetical protein